MLRRDRASARAETTSTRAAMPDGSAWTRACEDSLWVCESVCDSHTPCHTNTEKVQQSSPPHRAPSLSFRQHNLDDLVGMAGDRFSVLLLVVTLCAVLKQTETRPVAARDEILNSIPPPKCQSGLCKLCIPGSVSHGSCCNTTWRCQFDGLWQQHICLPPVPWICASSSSATHVYVEAREASSA